MERPRPPPDRHARPRRLRLRGVAASPRARASCSLVDASQGIEAQTLANCYLALEHDLAIVAALNKIDLPAAEPDRYADEIERVLGIPADEILRISAKTGEGVPELLDAVDRAHPRAEGRPRRAAAGADLRLVLRPVPRGHQLGARVQRHADDRRPAALPAGERGARRRGDRRARSRCPRRCRRSAPARSATSSPASRTSARPAVGETVTEAARPGRGRSRATATRSRWCSAASIRSTATSTPNLREALERLRLNDSSFTYEPETSGALGFGFRCGFLGLLHMEIVRERLEREYDLSLVATAPNVEYRVHTSTARSSRSTTRRAMPAPNEIERDRGAVREGHGAHARPIHGHADGAVPDSGAARWRRWSTSRPSASSSSTAAARRDRHRLLRPDEEPHPGLREPRLRARGLPAVEPREGRRAAQRRAGRRVLHDRAPRQGLRLRPRA